MQRRTLLRNAAPVSAGLLTIGSASTVSATELEDIELHLYRDEITPQDWLEQLGINTLDLWYNGDVWASDYIDLSIHIKEQIRQTTLNYADSSDELLRCFHNYCEGQDYYEPYTAHHIIADAKTWDERFGSNSPLGEAYVGSIIPPDKMKVDDCASHFPSLREGGSRSSAWTSISGAAGVRSYEDVFGTLLHEFGHNAMHPGHDHHNMYDYRELSTGGHYATCMSSEEDDCLSGESDYSGYYSNPYVWGDTCGYAISSWLMYGEPNGTADANCQVEDECGPGISSDTADDLGFVVGPNEKQDKVPPLETPGNAKGIFGQPQEFAGKFKQEVEKQRKKERKKGRKRGRGRNSENALDRNKTVKVISKKDI